VSEVDHKLAHATLFYLLTVYFVRHGQAGNRQDYDRLSAAGQAQARSLGLWLARQELRFDQAWSGCLNRQRETAEYVRCAYHQTGAVFPAIAISPCWDEFDLEDIYRGIGPQIALKNEEFRRELEALERESCEPDSPVHRRWTRCDTAVVRAWVENRYVYGGESFDAFVRRVQSGAALFSEGRSREARSNVIVFTSATPTAVWAATALELDANETSRRKILRLAGVTYNTAMTVIRLDGERARLFQFNTVPHIDGPALLTYR
jgi:broad specificity phosphatase PhoE